MPTIMVINLTIPRFADYISSTIQPTHWWRFAETSGNVADEQGNSPDLTASNISLYNQTGPLGAGQTSSALGFNGVSNQELQLQSSPFFLTDATTGYQACFFKSQVVGGGGRIMDQAQGLSQAMFWQVTGNGNVGDFVRLDAGLNQSQRLSTAPVVRSGRWHFLVWQQPTANSGSREFWVDGVQVTSFNDTVTGGGANLHDWSDDVGPTTGDRFGFGARHTQSGSNSSRIILAEYMMRDNATLSQSQMEDIIDRARIDDQTNSAQGIFDITVGANGSLRGFDTTSAVGSKAQNSTVQVNGQPLHAIYNQLNDTLVVEVEGTGLLSTHFDNVRVRHDPTANSETLLTSNATFNATAGVSPNRASWTWTGTTNWDSGDDGQVRAVDFDWDQTF